MSVLAHYLESAGLPTVVISLVRLHSDKVRPPRALFVPYELGRPLGEPNNAALQRDIIVKALALLENDSPPPISSRYRDTRGIDLTHPWRVPENLSFLQEERLTYNTLRDELDLIVSMRSASNFHRDRSAFGNADMSASDCAKAFLTLVSEDALATESIASKTARFVVDDIKTLYFEAATLGTTNAPSPALCSWFWRETNAGLAITTFRARCLEGKNKGRRLISSFLVPGEWVDKLGL